jgi:hypothetical protein
MAKGSLLPENAVGGGAVPDGDYIIKEIQTGMFDYGGRTEEVPAITVLYAADDGSTVEQSYSAGKGAKLMDPPDGKRFEVMGKNSNAFQWIGSMLSSGFPKAQLDDDVTVFKGCRVTVVNQAQPKRPGLKDQTEGKTIPLVTKVLALPGKIGVTPKAPARPTAAATASKTAPPAASSNGEPTELDARAIEVIQQIVATAPDLTISRLKLGTAIMLGLAKAKDPQMAVLKKMGTDAAWLTQYAELGGWTFDNDTLVLQQ